MAGRPGTPRFGMYNDDHRHKPDASGVNEVATQADDVTFKEQHYLFNPSQQSRAMGTTLGDPPGDYYEPDGLDYCAPANHDGFMGGDAHLESLDEKKVMDRLVYSVPLVCADDNYKTFSSDERTA